MLFGFMWTLVEQPGEESIERDQAFGGLARLGDAYEPAAGGAQFPKVRDSLDWKSTMGGLRAIFQGSPLWTRGDAG